MSDFKKEQEQKDAAEVWFVLMVIVSLLVWMRWDFAAAVLVFLSFLVLGELIAKLVMWMERQRQEEKEKERQQSLEPPKPVFLFFDPSETRDGL